MDLGRTLRLTAVESVSSRHVVLSFKDRYLDAYQPGQFVMVWSPGVDEVPMAIWGGRDGVHKLLVEAKGDCTIALAGKKAGDLVGIRGPYGRAFRLDGKRPLVVVGGTGTAPLVPFCERNARQAKIDVVLGGRSKEFLLLRREFEATGARVHVSTDDGSDGFHGRAPDLVQDLLAKGDYDHVLACGPERMMKAVLDHARGRKIRVQASVERWMKCAVGICDACLLDGVRLCTDGPVVDGETLARSEDFGRFEREPSGARRPIH